MKKAILKVIDELEKQSILEKTRKVDIPPEDRMLAITRETGQLLNTILRIKNAKRVLEIGTSVGYSTIWCAEAVSQHDGIVVTIEKNPSKIKRAMKNFEASDLSKIIEIREGTALQILIDMNKDPIEPFDLVLIDADKEHVIEYFDLVLPLTVKGGVIVTDNMLYPEKYRDEMQRLANHIRDDLGLWTVTVDVGNGEEITIKS